MGQCVRFCIIPGTIVLVMGGVSVDAGEVEVYSKYLGERLILEDSFPLCIFMGPEESMWPLFQLSLSSL